MCQANASNSIQEGGSANTGDRAGSDILQRLVSEAVKKVLQHPEILAGSVSSGSESSIPQALVSQVVEELKPCASQVGADIPVSEPPAPRMHKAYLPPAGIPSYKPTPISELKKRHIPVPYTPSPAPRGTSKVQVKRLSPSDDSSRLKRSKTDAKDSQKAEQEYNPETEVSVKNVAYSPSSVKYSPPHNGWSGSNQPPSYIPSSIDKLSKCSNDYIPSPVNSSALMPQYCPTEKSDSSTEPNYVPIGSESNTSEVLYMPTVKTELENDIVDIDFSTEFDLLDEILNENSNESQNGRNLKTEEDCNVMHNAVNRDVPELNVESDKSEIDISVKVEPKDVSHGSKHSQKMGTEMHAPSHSEPHISSSSRKKEDKLKSDKSKSKRHSSEKTKEQRHKKHDHKHSSSSRSEHRKSGKSEKRDRTKKKDTSGDSKSQKHDKVKEESRTKEKRVHSSERHSEKHSSSILLVKGKCHSGTRRLKHEGQDQHRHHHHHRYKSKHTVETCHGNSRSHNKKHKTVTLTTKEMAKVPPAEDGINAGKLFWLY
jgi:hypothetical protein